MLNPVTSAALAATYTAEASRKETPQNTIEKPAAEEPAAVLSLSREVEILMAADGRKTLNNLEFYDSGLRIDMNNIPTSHYGFHAPFNPKGVEFAACEYLYGKVENYVEVATELGQLLFSRVYGNGETVEERTANREAGLKFAEYLAQTYADDPVEADNLMQMANRAVETDVWWEKGYEVSEGETPAAHVRPKYAVQAEDEYYARLLGYDLEGLRGRENLAKKMEYLEAKIHASKEFAWNLGDLRDPDNFDGFMQATQTGKYTNGEVWNDKHEKLVAENEKRVNDAIARGKAALSQEQLAGRIQNLLQTLNI